MRVTDIPKVTLKEAQDFFFKGALKCYCGGAKKKTEIAFPGQVTYSHMRADGKLLYVDRYKAPGLQSGGETTMYVADKDGFWIPFWLMHYDGWEVADDKAVITILKKALVDAYSRKEFYGGRGAMYFYGCAKEDAHRCIVTPGTLRLFGPENLSYCNNYTGDFKVFESCENIYKEDANQPISPIVFAHHISGRALIPLK